MSKVYCIVKSGTNVYIPIKAEKNPHNGDTAYLKQLPNFFGGTVKKAGRRRPADQQLRAQALHKELSEESQDNIGMDAGFILGQMRDGLLLKTKVNQEDYWFYLLSIPQGVNLCPIYVLDKNPSRPGEQREMDFIIQVPIADIINRIKAATVAETETDPAEEAMSKARVICLEPDPDPNMIDEFANKILSACSNILSVHSNILSMHSNILHASYRNIQKEGDRHFTNLINSNSNTELAGEWNESETRKAFAILAAVLLLGLNGNPRFSSERE